MAKGKFHGPTKAQTAKADRLRAAQDTAFKAIFASADEQAGPNWQRRWNDAYALATQAARDAYDKATEAVAYWESDMIAQGRGWRENGRFYAY